MIDELRRYEKTLRSFQNIRNSIDYKFKSYIIKENVDKIVNKLELSRFHNIRSIVTGEIFLNSYDTDTVDFLTDILIQKYGSFSYLEAYRINNARSHRTHRLKNRVGRIISKRSYFLTLTFTDITLSETSPETRRRYVARYLKSITDDYVGNIDFGEKKGREHYHAVVQCEHIDSKLWKYGALNFELITYTDDTSDDTNIRLSKYVSKLTNHAIKETTKRTSLIYPKKKI